MGWSIILLVGILIHYSVVSVVETRLRIPERSSWISPEFLSGIVGVSLKRSKCANVHISGDSVNVKTIFKDFTRVYPGEYMLIDTTDRCYGHFMISSSADRVATILKQVPGKTSTEILIVIDDEVDESSKLFNVSLYGYANVDIVSRNGLRTLSENFLEPRVFKNISSYTEIVRKRGLVNFRGRELQASSFHKPPFTYIKTTVNRTIKGIKAQVFTLDDESEVDGVEIKLFQLMAQRLNFTWTIRHPTNHAGISKFGQRNGTKWNGGMVAQLVSGEVDIGFAGMWLTQNNYEFGGATQPWSEVSILFLVPRPKPLQVPWALATPLSGPVWIATLVMLIVQSIYVCVKAWLVPEVPQGLRNFVVSLTEMMAQLLGNSSFENIRGFRVHFNLWYIIGILMVTAYTSNLAARLTNFGYEPRIDTVEDIVAANLTWGRIVTPLYSLVLDESDPTAQKFIKRYEDNKDEADQHAKIERGNFAIVGTIVGNVFRPDDPVRKSDFENYRAMRDSTTQHYTSFGVQPWLLEPVNEMIIRLREAGIIDYHLQDVIRRREPYERREVFVEHDLESDEPRILELIPLTVAFIIFVVGITISSVVFYVELRHASRGTSIYHLLRQIKEKRENRRDGKNLKDYGIAVLTELRSKKYGSTRSG